eukprot:Hpha_TRINITY_DN17583_c0_g1::TRINITY_DN17583_c0_g1_i1::g.92561::m.92561
MLNPVLSLVSAAVLCLGFFPAGAAGHRYSQYGLLVCSACRCVTDELVTRRAKIVAQERAPLQVSHRLGKGQWDHHGSGGVKKVNFETSELMAIEVIEGLCGAYAKEHKLREKDGDRFFSTNTSLPEASYYSKAEKDRIGDSRKVLKEVCEDLLDEHDEHVHEAVRLLSDPAELFKSLCVTETKVCADKTLAPFKAKEAKARKEWQGKERKRWKRWREEESVESVQMAEFRVKSGEAVLNLTATTATSPTGNSPSNEGPSNLIDGNVTSKWLDWRKAPFEITLKVPSFVTAFTFVTANDHPERDPVRWVLSALPNEAQDLPTTTELTEEPAPEASTFFSESEEQKQEREKQGQLRKKAFELAKERREQFREQAERARWVDIHVQSTAHAVSWEREKEQEWFSVASGPKTEWKLWKALRFTPGKRKKAKPPAEGPGPEGLGPGVKVTIRGKKQGVVKDQVSESLPIWGRFEELRGGWVVEVGTGGEVEWVAGPELKLVDDKAGEL